MSGAGCVFTSRPMIPATGGESDASNVYAASGDAATTGPTDGVQGRSDGGLDAAPDGPPPNADLDCNPRAVDGGDGGFVDRDGGPCDPERAGDASADAATDGHDDAADGDAR